jgi:hydrogenase maturation protease
MMCADDHGADSRKVLVLGLGNPDRGDDGVGALVARELGKRLPPDVVVKIRSADMLSLIDDWYRFDAVVCIDAAEPSGVDGRICRFDLNSAELPTNLRPGSSHAWGLPEAIALGRALRMAPRQIVVYAIEGNSFDGGAALTPAVAAAARAVADRVVEEVDRLRLG